MVYKAAAFATAEGLLVFGGQNPNRLYYNRIYEWTESTNTWQVLDLCPFDLDADIPHFQYQGRYYFINRQNEVHVFDPNAVEWSFIGIYPGQVGGGGISVVMKDRVFVGIFTGENDIWEMDLLTNRWILKNGFIGEENDVNVSYWQNEGEIFLIKDNFFGAGVDMPIYKFNPDAF